MPRWVTSEVARSGVCVGVAFVLTFVVGLALLLSFPQIREEFVVVGPMMSWTLFAVVHALITWLAFRALGHDQLQAALAVETRAHATARRRGTSWLRTLVTGGTGAGWSVQVSLLALLAVAALLLVPGLRQEPVVLATGLAMVAASWIDVAVVYTLHYARVNGTSGSLRFPGEEPPTFSDYRYLAVGVQTTFGTTDVEVRTSVMRRVVTGHALLAFVFNTVIVAIVVSLLLSSTS